ncbi:Thioredoxin [Actinoalloteichus sp. GBA129-24]|nr:Thioredoxin [Actinoalloteichus sp. GBA129-24]
MAGLSALVVAIVAALLIGALHRRAQGRVSVAAEAGESAVTSPGLPLAVQEALTDATAGSAAEPRPVVTLLQLSTTFCAPCRHTRALLTDLVSGLTSVRHVDLDVTDRPDVVTALRVHRVPTTIAFDPAGRELLRVGGVPHRETLLNALRPHLLAADSED